MTVVAVVLLVFLFCVREEIYVCVCVTLVTESFADFLGLAPILNFMYGGDCSNLQARDVWASEHNDIYQKVGGDVETWVPTSSRACFNTEKHTEINGTQTTTLLERLRYHNNCSAVINFADLCLKHSSQKS